MKNPRGAKRGRSIRSRVVKKPEPTEDVEYSDIEKTNDADMSITEQVIEDVNVENGDVVQEEEETELVEEQELETEVVNADDEDVEDEDVEYEEVEEVEELESDQGSDVEIVEEERNVPDGELDQIIEAAKNAKKIEKGNPNRVNIQNWPEHLNSSVSDYQSLVFVQANKSGLFNLKARERTSRLHNYTSDARSICDVVVDIEDGKRRARSGKPMNLRVYGISSVLCAKSKIFKNLIIEARYRKQMQTDQSKSHYILLRLPKLYSPIAYNVLAWLHTGNIRLQNKHALLFIRMLKYLAIHVAQEQMQIFYKNAKLKYLEKGEMNVDNPKHLENGKYLKAFTNKSVYEMFPGKNERTVIVQNHRIKMSPNTIPGGLKKVVSKELESQAPAVPQQQMMIMNPSNVVLPMQTMPIEQRQSVSERLGRKDRRSNSRHFASRDSSEHQKRSFEKRSSSVKAVARYRDDDDIPPVKRRYKEQTSYSDLPQQAVVYQQAPVGTPMQVANTTQGQTYYTHVPVPPQQPQVYAQPPPQQVTYQQTFQNQPQTVGHSQTYQAVPSNPYSNVETANGYYGDGQQSVSVGQNVAVSQYRQPANHSSVEVKGRSRSTGRERSTSFRGRGGRGRGRGGRGRGSRGRGRGRGSY